jgi:1-acyl-sn-glycerol-3-phosphate acyltransferase
MAALRRRAVSVTALFVAAVALVVLLPVWLPLALLADVVRLRFRLPTVRLLAFGLCWAWLETCGVVVAAVLWCTGRRGSHRAHYALQRWWAARLIGALRVTTGLRFDTPGAAALRPGPCVLLCRHASLADSLLSAWVITTVAGMNPRYVLKRELLADPCLDIVGNRLPNHFLDREATDSSAELASLRDLSAGLRDDEVAVIFPEGTRAADHKRSRALARIGERQPERAERLAGLAHLLPPRPAGAAALVAGHPGADVVIAWHVGFDGLDTFGGILRHLARPPRHVEFHARRVPRSEVPDPEQGDAFTHWLDDAWLDADHQVRQLLS